MKCPTCKDAVEGCCCCCGLEIPVPDQELRPDPYGSEMADDQSPHLQCPECNAQSAGDV
jgi:hypothetical protein